MVTELLTLVITAGILCLEMIVNPASDMSGLTIVA